MLKKLTPFILLICYATAAHADDATALALAQQAGSIAGIAQACGQDVSLLNTRIAEAIKALANTEGARTKALVVYTQNVNTAASQQQATQKVDCGQIKQDYQSLPILRNDYQDSVISQLKEVGQVTPEQTQAAKTAVASPAAVPGAAVPPVNTTPTQTIPNVVGQPPSINPNATPNTATPIAPLQNTTASGLDTANEAIQPTPPTPDVGNPFTANPVTPAPVNPASAAQQAPNSSLTPQAGQTSTPSY